MMRVTISAGILTVLFSLSANGAGDFLKDAAESGRALSEIRDEFGKISGDMEKSNVFDPGEIKQNNEQGEKIESTRELLTENVVKVLEKSVADPAQSATHYQEAYKGHQKVISSLEAIVGTAKAAGDNSLLQDYIAKLKELYARVEAQAKKESQNTKLSEADIDRYAVVAKETATLATLMPTDKTKRLIEDAAGDLDRKSATRALEKIGQAIKELEAADTQKANEIAELYNKQSQLNELAEKIDEHIKEVRSLKETTDSNKAMDALMKMDQTQRALAAMDNKAAAEDIKQAQKDLAENKVGDAMNDLKDAKKLLDAEKKALAQEIKAKMDQQAAQLAAIAKADETIKAAEQFSQQISALETKQQEALAQGQKQQGQEAQKAGQMSPENKDALSKEMQQVSQEMQQQGMTPPGQNMEEAGKETAQDQHAEAGKSMDKAQEALQQAIQAAQAEKDKNMSALAEAKGGKPQGNTPPQPGGQQQAQTPGQDAQPQPGGPPVPGMPAGKAQADPQGPGHVGEPRSAAALTQRKSETGWHEKMPELERQALLSARKEKSTPEMSDAVKQYYMSLSK